MIVVGNKPRKLWENYKNYWNEIHTTSHVDDSKVYQLRSSSNSWWSPELWFFRRGWKWSRWEWVKLRSYVNFRTITVSSFIYRGVCLCYWFWITIRCLSYMFVIWWCVGSGWTKLMVNIWIIGWCNNYIQKRRCIWQVLRATKLFITLL